MRLTCPTCGASYDLPAASLPQGGGHVQCSACHTRWFVRAETPPPARFSEDEIITRLETRGAATAPPEAAAGSGAAEAAPAAPAAAAPIPFPRPARPAPEAAPRASAPAPEAEQTFGIGPDAAPRPAREPGAAAAAAAGPLRPRSRPDRPPAFPQPPEAEEGGGRAWLGALLAFAIAGGGLALYLNAEAAALRAPVAAGAIEAYAARIDAARAWLETRVGPFRDAVTGG